MSWEKVGGWLKQNAGSGAVLVGSLLTGNIPAAVAAGVSLVSSATGESDPGRVLERLQTDPQTVIRLKELAIQDESSIREHIRAMAELQLKDEQAAHKEQQDTIRSGDNSEDPYVRHTRPMMARQSWYGMAAYIAIFEGLRAFKVTEIGASLEMAMIIGAPGFAYIGFRSVFEKTGLSSRISKTLGGKS